MSFAQLNEIIQDYNSAINLFYIGTVVENNDPLGLDRIKVSVPELYDPKLSDLPWCVPVKYPVFGQGSGYGFYGVPALNSTVVILLQKNDPNYPMYIGSIMMGSMTGLEAGFDSPQKYGFIDPSGNKLQVDMSEQLLTFTHSSGATIRIDKGNKITVNCNDVEVNAQSTATVNTETSTINCTTSNINCTTSNVDSDQFNVTANQLDVTCPTNNFSGIINCASIATGYGGSSGTATIAGDLEVIGDATISDIQFSTHVHSGVEPGGSNTGKPQ